MFATLTSKGQLTLPKEIRDRLNLDAGAILDFQVQADNTITARRVTDRRADGCGRVEAAARQARTKPRGPEVRWPMIGIDTDVLLRLWLNDAPAQNRRIDVLLAAHGGMPGSLLVTDVVLVEAIWTLKSAFEQDKHAQVIAVRSLLEETAFEFEDREAVAAALSQFEAGTCGFADCLAVAKHVGRGCDFTATFDRGMRKLPGVHVL